MDNSAAFSTMVLMLSIWVALNLAVSGDLSQFTAAVTALFLALFVSMISSYAEAREK